MGDSTVVDELTTTLQDPWDITPVGVHTENIAENNNNSYNQRKPDTPHNHHIEQQNNT